MKKILTSILAASAFAAFGQGNINLDNLLSTGLVGVKMPNGDLAVGANFSAAVFNAAGDVLLGSGPFASQTTGARAGRFNLGLVEVAGAAVGSKAKLYVQVWDTSKGATYSASTLKGQSAVFETLPLGGNNPGDPLAPKLEGFTSFSLVDSSGGTTGNGGNGGNNGGTPAVPEPSTIALGALGAAALVLRFRK